MDIDPNTTTGMDSQQMQAFRLSTGRFMAGDPIGSEGQYVFEKWLGEGAMGKVFLVKDTWVDQNDSGSLKAAKIVCKFLSKDDKAVTTLKKEFSKMCMLTHPGIVAARHLVHDQYRLYLIMDFAEGETLDSYLQKNKKPELSVVLNVAGRLAAALDYAHNDEGILHRDVKPDNVMVKIEGRVVKSVKLMDFGISVDLNRTLTTTSNLTQGAAAYRSPEGWDEGKYGKMSFASDQYSLAAVLYEMLAGYRNYPFAGEFEGELGLGFLAVNPDKHPKRIDGIADYMNDALQKALAKKPEERFESCTAFVNAMMTKTEAKFSVQPPKTVEPPKTNVPPVASWQMDPKPQLASVAMKADGKASKRWMWILAVVALVGVLALIAGLSAERERRKGEKIEEDVKSDVKQVAEAITKDERGVTEKELHLKINSYQQGEDRVVELNGVKMTMKHIKAGTFTMGSPTSEEDRFSDESLHRVTLTKDFWLGETEVTQEQYKAIMGKNPSNFSKGGAYPVECVSWKEAMAFCERLTKAERSNGNLPDGYEYTLPTEAQWEYAARGGHNNNQNHIYSGSDEINEVAWYDNNSNSSTHPVGQKRANELGLYDMSGNVWEWCRDWFGDYPSGSVTDPVGSSSGSYRVLRGGSWFNLARNCRSAYRGYFDPTDRYSGGFRVALAPVQ